MSLEFALGSDVKVDDRQLGLMLLGLSRVYGKKYICIFILILIFIYVYNGLGFRVWRFGFGVSRNSGKNPE